MPNIFDKVGKVEPCDGRDLLQKLTYLVVSELASKKVKICEELAESFGSFGLQNFSPCDLVDNTSLEQLVSGDLYSAMNPLLISQNFPPHTLKLLQEGYNSLSTQEKKDLENYTIQLGIQYVQGKIEPLLQEQIKKILQCPTEPEALKLLTKLENITRIVSGLQSKLNRLEYYVTPASATVSALNIAFQTANKTILGLDLTLPATAATPTGASGLIARVIGKVERFIDNNQDDLKKLDDNLCNAAKAIKFANTQLIIIISFIEVLDALIRTCIVEQSNLPEVTARLSPITFQPSSQDFQYRGYDLEIRTDQQSIGPAPRRYAVAIDRLGVVVLEGPKSFSSSTDILLEELKFRIDNHLG